MTDFCLDFPQNVFIALKTDSVEDSVNENNVISSFMQVHKESFKV